MKLIDILALELKEWPAGVFAIEQSDCGTYLFRHNGSVLADIEVTEQAEDHATAVVTRGQWQAAVDALNAPVRNVEGLPPVGAVRKVIRGNVFWSASEEEFIGQEVTVRHVFRNKHQTFIAVVENHSGNCLALRVNLLELIRTPEQIAKEERKAWANQCREDSKANGCSAIAFDAATALYDAGYRKVAP